MVKSGFHRTSGLLVGMRYIAVSRIEKILNPDKDNLVAVILRIGAVREPIGYRIRGNPVQRPVIPVISSESL
jgi:hypothetical protein